MKYIKQYENTKKIWGNKPHIKEYEDTMEELFKFFQTVIGIPYEVTVKVDSFQRKIVCNFYNVVNGYLCIQIVSQVISHNYGGTISDIKYFLKLEFETWSLPVAGMNNYWVLVDYLMDESVMSPESVETTNNKGDIIVAYEIPINNLGVLRRRLTLDGLKRSKALKQFDL